MSVRNETWCPKPFRSPHATLRLSVGPSLLRVPASSSNAQSLTDYAHPLSRGNKRFLELLFAWGVLQ